MARASQADREYFARVARQSRALEQESAPASLAEMFDRLDRIRQTLGSLARPGLPEDEEGDLASHLARIARMRTVRRGGAQRS